MVVKPSEVAPLNAFILSEIIADAGLPPGVFNLVCGTGPEVGEAIASHKSIDMVSFTGSTRAGIRVAELAAKSVKRVTQELGGKSANIILDDADLDKAVPRAINACFLNSGQTCSALTRLLVPQSKVEEVAKRLKAQVDALTFGPADQDGVQYGPLVSDIQLERVRSFIKSGIKEGAHLLTGGVEKPKGLDKGFFVKPTVFTQVEPSMTIAKEEIFGPVLVVIAYKDEDQAVAIANDTVYGLAGGVSSASAERAKAIAKRLRAGQIDINTNRFNHCAPFGGYKQSGNGREFGEFGIERVYRNKIFATIEINIKEINFIRIKAFRVAKLA